jgi:DNA-binding CsgD family transcriptional regulator
MIVYPLSNRESETIRWTSRIIPTLAVAVILFLGAVSLAAMRG